MSHGVVNEGARHFVLRCSVYIHAYVGVSVTVSVDRLWVVIVVASMLALLRRKACVGVVALVTGSRNRWNERRLASAA